MRFDRTAVFLAAALVTGLLSACNRDSGTGAGSTSPGTTTSPPPSTTSPPAATVPDTTMPPASAASQ